MQSEQRFLHIQGTTKAKSKKGKSIAVGKSARRMDMDYDEYLGDEFDDFMWIISMKQKFTFSHSIRSVPLQQ